MTEPVLPPRIAYLTGWYPAVSLTFILREVLALRAEGLAVETCAIRRTAPREHRGPDEKAAAAETFYVLAAARDPRVLLGAIGAALARPGRLWRTLRLAVATCPAGLRAALYQMFYLIEAMILARHLRVRGITRIHNHFTGASCTVAMLAAGLTGIPFSFTLHGPADLVEPIQIHLRTKIAQADLVACISHFARSQAMLHSDPAHWGKLRIVHCGVNPDLYDRPDTTGTVAPKGRHLVFVGRVAPVKGLRVLIEAVQMARAQEPDLRLTVVGDGPDRAALEGLAAPLGSAVRFTGYLSQAEVAEVLASADAMVLPSFAEGVPVVLMEMLASGRPVIATQVAGVSELVEDGVTGRIVAPGDAAGLATALVAFARMPEGQRAAMGEAGRARVRAEFDIRHEAAWLARLFRGTDGGHLRPETPQASMVAREKRG